jgi:hypothetical protein
MAPAVTETLSWFGPLTAHWGRETTQRDGVVPSIDLRERDHPFIDREGLFRTAVQRDHVTIWVEVPARGGGSDLDVSSGRAGGL